MCFKSYFKVLFKAFAHICVREQTTFLYLNEQKYTQATQNVEPNKNPTPRIPRTPQSSTRPHRKRPIRQKRQNLPQPNRNPTSPHSTSRRRRQTNSKRNPHHHPR